MIIKDIEVKTVLSKSNLPVSDYAVNPYVGCLHACKYCYASFMKRFTNHPEPWGTFLDIKHWPDIKNPAKYKGKELFLSSVTDPYQPHEAKYKRTRALLEQMRGSGAKISISTKSDLILRDLDLIKTFPDARVSWSINTLDEDFRRAMDNGVSIERRLEAMRRFYEAGVQTTCFISPIFPGLTDVVAIIISSLYFGALHLHKGLAFMIGATLLLSVFGFIYSRQGTIWGLCIPHYFLGLSLTVIWGA